MRLQKVCLCFRLKGFHTGKVFFGAGGVCVLFLLHEVLINYLLESYNWMYDRSHRKDGVLR